MSVADNIPSEVSPPPELPVTAPRRSGLRIGLISLLLLLLIIAGVAIYGLWFTLQQLQNRLTIEISDVRIQVSTLQTQQAAVQVWMERFKTAETELQQLQQAKTATLAEIEQIHNRITRVAEQPRSDWDWAKAEIVYLLNLANYRLTLTHDSATALAILQVTDFRLRQLDNPAWLAVREQVVQAIEKLKALPSIDTQGIALQLAHYARETADLPLVQGMRVTKTPQLSQRASSDNADWTESILNSLNGLVQVRYNENAQLGLLSVEQRGLLAQTLSLQLETARTALLSQNTDAWKNSLSTADSWLKRHFDQNDARIQQLQAELQRLMQLNLTPPLPNLVETLQILQRLPVQPPAN